MDVVQILSFAIERNPCELEKFALCPVCLKKLRIDLFLFSHGYFYDENVIELSSKFNNRQKIAYCIPIAKINVTMDYFEKDAGNNFRELSLDLSGCDQDGSSKGGLIEMNTTQSVLIELSNWSMLKRKMIIRLEWNPAKVITQETNTKILMIYWANAIFLKQII